MPRRRKNLHEQYYPYLRRVMALKDGRPYNNNPEFTEAQLLELRPSHLVRYMSLQAFGTETPGPNDRPIHRRSTGLAFIKKAVSYFMPNRNSAWNVETQTGNPTMSVAVNDLIK